MVCSMYGIECVVVCMLGWCDFLCPVLSHSDFMVPVLVFFAQRKMAKICLAK